MMLALVFVPGVIRCIAAQQCGGEMQLDAAVAKGEVVEGTHNGIRMYFIPSVRMREMESSGNDQVSNRRKGISVETHQDPATGSRAVTVGWGEAAGWFRVWKSGWHGAGGWCGVVWMVGCMGCPGGCMRWGGCQDFGAAIAETGYQLIRPGCSGSISAGGSQASDAGDIGKELMDLASANAEDLSRAIGMAETVLGKTDESSCKSKWAQRTLGALQEALPAHGH